MKKIILFSLVFLSLLLPAVVTTANASGHWAKRIASVSISGWVLLANSEEEDGEIYKVQVYSAATGQLVRCEQGDGYTATVNMAGLPTGGYNVLVICANATYSEQTKL